MQPQVNLVNLTGKTLTFLAYVDGKQIDIVIEPTESTVLVDSYTTKRFHTNGILTFVESNVLNLPEPKKDTAYIVTSDILCLCGNTRNDVFSCNSSSTGYAYNLYRGPFVEVN